MDSTQIFLTFLLLYTVNLAESLKLGQFCSSNSANNVRGCDSQGCGHYGASRGTRTHQGVDIVCNPGSRVMAPFSGEILRRSFPYANNNAPYNNGLYIKGTGNAQGFKARIFYFTPDKTSGSMKKGDTLGTSQALPYQGITQHLHVILFKNNMKVDPQPYL